MTVIWIDFFSPPVAEAATLNNLRYVERAECRRGVRYGCLKGICSLCHDPGREPLHRCHTSGGRR